MLDCSIRDRGTPLNETSPVTVMDGGLRPPSIEIKDVFPDPEGPMSPKTSVGCTTPLTLYSTCTQETLVTICVHHNQVLLLCSGVQLCWSYTQPKTTPRA